MKLDKSSTTLYVWIFSLSLFFKLFLGWLLPLVPDESYYWVWSHHLQLSYFDHPPFVSWLFLLGHFFEPFGSAVRWPAILMGHATFLIWFFVAREILSDKFLFWFTLLYLANPILGPGSIIVTPDIPLLFFWGLGVLLLTRIHSTPHWGYFLAYGIVVGLGFLSKYHMALQGLLALFSVFFNPRLKKEFRLHIFAAVLVAAALALPVLIWNINNDWASFQFQLAKRLSKKIYKSDWTLSFVFGQFFLLLPYVIYSAYRKWPRIQNTQILWLTTLLLPLFFLLSFRGRIEGNWTVAAFPALLLLATYNSQKIHGLVWTIVLHAVFFAGALVQVYHPWLPVDPDSLKTSEFFRYKSVSDETRLLENLFARNYQLAAQLSFDRKEFIYKLRGSSRKDFYDFRSESVPKSLPYFFVAEPGEELPAWATAAGQRILSSRPLPLQLVLFEVGL